MRKFYASLEPSDPAKKLSHFFRSDDRGLFFGADISSASTSIPDYEVIHPKTKQSVKKPSRGWGCTEPVMIQRIKEGRVLFGENESTIPLKKSYLTEVDSIVKTPVIYKDGRGASLVLRNLFGKDVFENPKDHGVLGDLINYASGKDATVLDFFGGSGSTAQAVLESNKQDDGNRTFILVQLPEKTEHKDFPTIADITKERVRLVIKKLNEADKNQLALGQNKKQDRGFKVFKLQSSNFKAWNAEQPKDDAELVKQLTLHVDHLVAGRSQEDVLYELLLKSGFPLDTKVEKITLAEKSVFSIADGAMLICLEKELTPEVIKAMAEKKPERVVCLDAGFADNDQLKTNAVQTMKSKGVTKFQTV